jgi:hypothetical protein
MRRGVAEHFKHAVSNHYWAQPAIVQRIDWEVSMNTSECLELLLVVVTGVLAVATFYLAYQTHRLVSLSSVSEDTRLSMEQNWRLWEHRKEVWVPVAPQGLTDEEWKWRLSILNHLNLLLLAYRSHTFGVAKLWGKKNLGPRATKSKRVIGQVRNDQVGRGQLRQLLQRGEGFPQDFIGWMEDQGIITGADYL